ncbi:MAG TPA: hypothetical protein VNU26_10335 [Mycobacteriales bacterium]|nr:hypothetical protein [Mycobacteriales bacterium]
MLIVDAANVVGSRPDGWWRDRPGAAARLVARLRSSEIAGRHRVVVVLEGQARAGVAEGTVTDGVEVRHATGEGDDLVVELAAAFGAAGQEVLVVTADRGLRDRVTDVGARVEGPRWLEARLPAR